MSKVMLKRQRDAQKEVMDKFKKTYGEFKFIFRDFDQDKADLSVKKELIYDSEDRARLQEPDTYPYEQKHRLYRKSTEAAKKSLEEIARIMQYVPDSYKVEILNSTDFFEFNRMALRSLKVKESKNAVKDYDPAIFKHYYQMLLYGIEGIKTSMPLESATLLLQQLQPFLLTVQTISALARTGNPKARVPQFIMPDELLSMNPINASSIS
jgi:hypothetical protein